MELEGKIIRYLGEQSGTSKAGKPWKKKEWVAETFGTYPRKVKFHIFGERADNINLEVGKDYSMTIEVESREFNDRWYTDVSVLRAQELTANPQGNAYGQPGGYPSAQNSYPSQGANGMPFGSEATSPYGGQTNFGASQGSFAPSPGDSDEDLPF